MSGAGNMQQELEAEQERWTWFGRAVSGKKAQVMNAMEGDREDKKKGCFWKYMYGECTNKDCTMDHRDETIQSMWKKKVWDLAKAVKSPGCETLVSELQRALRDAQAVI